MKKKLLFIDPVYDNSYKDLFLKSFNEIKGNNTEVDFVSLGDKPGPDHLEYNCYEIMVMPDILRMVRQAEQENYDAVIIGCFYDPALRACREISRKMAISFPAEASLHIASTLGENISIIVGRQKWIPEIKENVHKYGFSNKIVSIKPLNLGVLDFQKDHKATLKKMRACAIEAVEKDGADAIILGCTMELGFYKQLQEELGVPVIDVSLAAFKYAEFFAELKQKLNWTHSKKVGYESPPLSEIKRFQPFL